MIKTVKDLTNGGVVELTNNAGYDYVYHLDGSRQYRTVWMETTPTEFDGELWGEGYAGETFELYRRYIVTKDGALELDLVNRPACGYCVKKF